MPLLDTRVPVLRLLHASEDKCNVNDTDTTPILQVVGSMEELYKFMNQSNATLDLKVGNELATEEGEPAEVRCLLYPLCRKAALQCQTPAQCTLTTLADSPTLLCTSKSFLIQAPAHNLDWLQVQLLCFLSERCVSTQLDGCCAFLNMPTMTAGDRC